MNAKKELLRMLDSDIVCAKICWGRRENIHKKLFLGYEHSEQELNEFLGCLNFKYNERTPDKEFFGSVFTKSGTMYIRQSYTNFKWISDGGI